MYPKDTSLISTKLFGRKCPYERGSPVLKFIVDMLAVVYFSGETAYRAPIIGIIAGVIVGIVVVVILLVVIVRYLFRQKRAKRYANSADTRSRNASQPIESQSPGAQESRVPPTAPPPHDVSGVVVEAPPTYDEAVKSDANFESVM